MLAYGFGADMVLAPTGTVYTDPRLTEQVLTTSDVEASTSTSTAISTMRIVDKTASSLQTSTPSEPVPIVRPPPTTIVPETSTQQVVPQPQIVVVSAPPSYSQPPSYYSQPLQPDEPAITKSDVEAIRAAAEAAEVAAAAAAAAAEKKPKPAPDPWYKDWRYLVPGGALVVAGGVLAAVLVKRRRDGRGRS